jgi:hypothetical protein
MVLTCLGDRIHYLIRMLYSARDSIRFSIPEKIFLTCGI